uniref:Ubiquitin-like 1-activating enzyme E1A n=1 Tax=Fibrocapsa japonica TaxID=94617 RepID=A0A7S2UZW6_9STRA|mmetsp:Transcript_17431/g.25451  ORF Transcript_17431/g.25451 Transcript_17431/m.25451 type:complete len:345 (+) Transcript_17431:16-1050(+)
MAAKGESMDEVENQVYDRQIRLWGLEAQQRMRSSRVLICGMGCLNAELCKNLVLAGVNVCLQDHLPVEANDNAGNIFVSAEDNGKNRAEACVVRAKELNGLVNVDCETKPLEDLDDSFFTAFTVVCVSGASRKNMLRLDTICREAGTFFYAGTAFGYDGVLFCDLGPRHHFEREGGPKTAPAAPAPAGGGGGSSSGAQAAPGEVASYPSLQDALGTKWSVLTHRRRGKVYMAPKPFVLLQVLEELEEQMGRPVKGMQEGDLNELVQISTRLLQDNEMPPDFLTEDDLRILCSVANTEISPVCAIVGGIWGQEVLKAISRKGEPVNNFFVFSGISSEGKVIRLPK